MAMKPEHLSERQRYEQTLMRTGRKLQSLGQLLEQAPAHLVAKGYPANDAVTGGRPVLIDLDEMRELFDPTSSKCVGDVLKQYHELLARLKQAGT
jgi:hypothetical protein